MCPRGKQIMAPPPHPLAVSIDKRLGGALFCAAHVNKFFWKANSSTNINFVHNMGDTSLFSYLELKIVGTKGHL